MGPWKLGSSDSAALLRICRLVRMALVEKPLLSLPFS